MKCSYCSARHVRMWRPIKGTRTDFSYSCAHCLAENHAAEIKESARAKYLLDYNKDLNTDKWAVVFVRETCSEPYAFLHRGWWYKALRNGMKIVPAMNRKKFFLLPAKR